jgi:hypothetical protein
MAWKVKLLSMSPVGNGSVDCQCEFYDTPTERAFTKYYNLEMINFPTLETIQAHMLAELARLDAFDGVMAQFGSFIGQDIV